MKRLAVLVCIALICAGVGRAAYRASAPQRASLAKFVPAGPLIYLEAKDLSSLLHDWNLSPQRSQWVQSNSYEVFSRSRLFLRLKGAGDQFAAAAGLPPDMDFLSQVAGEQSVLALYDIGKLQFVYITYLPSARSAQTTLWQARAKFEPRNSGGIDFYLRRDPQSQREVAFAVSGDYLLLATREDLMATTLQLMSGKQDRTVESESWWAQSTMAAGEPGDLRMVLDMKNLVPNGYFRTYWVQQNITDLSQYSAAISDLFRSSRQYREERVLIRKTEPQASAPEGPSAVADLSRLIPDNAGVYIAIANPTADACFSLLTTKLLAPHTGAVPASHLAPQVQLTSGEQGSGSDLETRIDQAPPESPVATESGSTLKMLLNHHDAASLLVQSSQTDAAGVFIRIHTAIALTGSADWNESDVHSAIAEFLQPSLTVSQLGVGWQQKSGYQELDGLLPLMVSVRGKYLVVSDDPGLIGAMLARFPERSSRKPTDYYAGFNHEGEHAQFARLMSVLDRPGMDGSRNGEHQPQFFSGNMASLSSTLEDASSERIEIHRDGAKVRQTVTYEWTH